MAVLPLLSLFKFDSVTTTDSVDVAMLPLISLYKFGSVTTTDSIDVAVLPPLNLKYSEFVSVMKLGQQLRDGGACL